MTSRISQSIEETAELARQLGDRIRAGMRIGLCGPLGAGKTTFAKAMISQLTGVAVEDIPSPTFTLVEEYQGKFPIYHVDLYRIETPEEGKELPWDDLFSPEALTLVEWPERLAGLLSHCQIEVHFSKEDNGARMLQMIDKDVL